MASTCWQCGARCSAKPPVDVKQSSARPPRAYRAAAEVILALVEKDAGFLAMAQIGAQRESVDMDFDRLRNFANHGGFEGQVLLLAHRRIVAYQNARWMEEFVERGEDIALGGVHSLIERLHGEVVSVAIDDEGGKQVGLPVHHAVGVAVLHYAAAVSFGRGQAAQVERAVDCFGLGREQTQRNLARCRIVRRSQGAALRVEHGDG